MTRLERRLRVLAQFLPDPKHSRSLRIGNDSKENHG